MARSGRIRSLLVSTALVASTLLVAAAPAGAVPIETVVVPTSAPGGQTSSTVLTAGTTYIFEARGTAPYGFQNGLFDPECSTLPPDPTWQPFRFFFLAPDSDFLDLLVNDDNVMWQPTTPDAFGCNSQNHRYRLTFTPETSGPVNFRVLDTEYSDNPGTFIVEIHQATETLVQTLTVPTNLAGGVSSVALNATKFYRIQASGTGTYDGPPAFNKLDAECTTFMPDPTWQPNRWLLLELQGDVGDLYINGQNVMWRPKTADLFGCDSTNHVYDVTFRPPSSGPVIFAVRDTFHGDNAGSLEVKIFELAFNPTEGNELLTPPAISLAEELQVDSTDPDGTTSTIPFPAGQQVLMEVSGTYTYWPPRTADARCSTLASSTFVPSEDNFAAPFLQLVINDQVVPWTPTTPDGTEPECNSTDHQYRLIFMPQQTGLLTFRIPDLNHSDNAGVLSVRIFRIREIPTGMVSVNSMNPAGTSTPPLLAGRTYRLRASGTYGYWQGVPGTSADAECAQADFVPINNPAFVRNQFGSGDNDLLDVFVNDGNVEWLTSAGLAAGCDPNHLFDHTLTASSNGPINLKVKDFNYGDNSGSVQVQLFLQVN